MKNKDIIDALTILYVYDIINKDEYFSYLEKLKEQQNRFQTIMSDR